MTVRDYATDAIALAGCGAVSVGVGLTAESVIYSVTEPVRDWAYAGGSRPTGALRVILWEGPQWTGLLAAWLTLLALIAGYSMLVPETDLEEEER